MTISDDEFLKTLRILITKYVPASLDKINVLEKLYSFDKTFLVPQNNKCPKCQTPMICLKCGEWRLGGG